MKTTVSTEHYQKVIHGLSQKIGELTLENISRFVRIQELEMRVLEVSQENEQLRQEKSSYPIEGTETIPGNPKEQLNEIAF